MIVPADLLAGLQRLLKRLEPDIRSRCEADHEIDARLRIEYERARSASRTAQAYEVWREDYITQVAVAWILSCVFVRFLEDNRLIDTVWLAGPHDRLQLARDQHTLYFQAKPTHSDREYLEHVFEEVAKLPSMRDLLGGSHNPILKVGPTGDGAHELLEFWQRVDPSAGAIIHDFSDPEWSTRFLGDLYQDLSKSARKKYALLQTPEFVEEFILDRTLSPAIDEFGYSKVRMIDPTCGSGHFLLGAFRRLHRLRVRHEPGENSRVSAQHALEAVHGVDLNPFAVAIARFRLLLAALKESGVARLAEAPPFKMNLAVGDSLLHGPRLGSELDRATYLDGMNPLQHVYDTEDADELRRILGQQYHAVVGNPPYIIVTDATLNAEYRSRFGSCHRQYSLAVPFMERFFHLALPPKGYVGMITANSFMKREFGKKLIEEYIPRWDVTHVVDTSRAHIPAHGTPTVILFGRNRNPVSETIRAVMGIRAEATTPMVPAQGLVWRAIIEQIDKPNSESAFVSVSDLPRGRFHQHPWSIGGGGAAELRTRVESLSSCTLKGRCHEIGFGVVTREDEVFLVGRPTGRRHRIPQAFMVPLVKGEDIRDWTIPYAVEAIWPYDSAKLTTCLEPSIVRFLYPWRAQLSRRVAYGLTQIERGLRWFEYSMFFRDRFTNPLSIAFAFVSTHNHFVLDRGAKVFKQSAPLIKLPQGSTETQHLELIGLLNSSTACFWMKQTFHNKGGGGIGGGLATEEWEQFYEFDATKLQSFPIPAETPLSHAQALDSLAGEIRSCLPARVVEREAPSSPSLGQARARAVQLSQKMVAVQEELDWRCYRLYGLIEDDLSMPDNQPPPIQIGERAFEILMARRMASGDLETTWFGRHGATPITEVPAHWPDGYRALVQRRISIIESDRDVALIEQPECKRRWNAEPWDDQESRALRGWLLQRMEEARYWPENDLTTCAKLADRLHGDAEFRQVAELYRGRSDFDFTVLITELIESESVPLLSVLRFSEFGLRKALVWVRNWELQRREDAVDAEVSADPQIPDLQKGEIAKKRKANEIGEIHPPPKYESKDFQKQTYWSLRGKLDVPKERFISFPFCERDADATAVIGWAGWDHLQQAQAIAAYYERVKNHEGWRPERRVPLLAGILELLPWLKQWHNDIHPEYKERMGNFFQQFVEDEARVMEMTIDQIRGWTPPVQSNSRGRKKRKT